ncbi:hypothetical protein ACRAWF_30445 [Streptomyces sp. L7]
MTDVMLAWPPAGLELGGRHFGPIIAERKKMYAALASWSPPPALGPVPEGLKDPAVQMLWGVTEKTIQAWAAVRDDATEVVGYAASPVSSRDEPGSS